jgi:hypothetical protein
MAMAVYLWEHHLKNAYHEYRFFQTECTINKSTRDVLLRAVEELGDVTWV